MSNHRAAERTRSALAREIFPRPLRAATVDRPGEADAGHKLTIERRSDGYRHGTCECGWISPKHAFSSNVWRDHQEHLAEGTK